MSLPDLSISQMGERLRDGSLTSVDLTQAHFDRIEALDPIVHAFAALTHELAFACAERADADFARGLDHGPFHGIPFAVKDLIDVEGTATTCGSRVPMGQLPREHAESIGRLVRAGAVVLGKLATYEFALVGPSFDQPSPPSLNPWNVDFITGGSSSGSAAAVAAGMVRTAIGTDTGGSIRSPAGYCGVVGLKPTFGRVSRHGVFPLSPSLDHVGPLSATVREAALTLDAIAGYDERDPGSSRRDWSPAARCLGQGVEGLRIGYARDWFAPNPDLMPEVLRAIDDAASRLARNGALIEEISLPDYDLMEAAGAIILHCEALDLHLTGMRNHGPDYGHQAYRSLAAGVCLKPDDLERARRIGRALRDEIDQTAFADCDAIITANTLSTAPPLEPFRSGAAVWTPMRTLPFNVTGHPGLALPVGFASGLPISMQIIGRAFDEATICRIGDFLEHSIDLATKPPLTGAV